MRYAIDKCAVVHSERHGRAPTIPFRLLARGTQVWYKLITITAKAYISDIYIYIRCTREHAGRFKFIIMHIHNYANINYYTREPKVLRPGSRSRFGQSDAAVVARFVAFFSEPLGSTDKIFPRCVDATAGHVPESVAQRRYGAPGRFPGCLSLMRASATPSRDIVRSEIPPPSSGLRNFAVPKTRMSLSPGRHPRSFRSVVSTHVSDAARPVAAHRVRRPPEVKCHRGFGGREKCVSDQLCRGSRACTQVCVFSLPGAPRCPSYAAVTFVARSRDETSILEQENNPSRL